MNKENSIIKRYYKITIQYKEPDCPINFRFFQSRWRTLHKALSKYQLRKYYLKLKRQQPILLTFPDIPKVDLSGLRKGGYGFDITKRYIDLHYHGMIGVYVNEDNLEIWDNGHKIDQLQRNIVADLGVKFTILPYHNENSKKYFDYVNKSNEAVSMRLGGLWGGSASVIDGLGVDEILPVEAQDMVGFIDQRFKERAERLGKRL